MSRLRTAAVTVRGEDFTIREWTAKDRAEFLIRMEQNKDTASAFLVARCTLTSAGERLFKDDGSAESEPAALVDELATEILKLSGMGAGDEKKA